MTYRQSVPAFLGGISQQSKALRKSNLVDDCLNIEHLPSEGATKRYPSEHIAEIAHPFGPLDASKIRAVAMPRDDDHFIAMFDDEYVRVFSVDGTEKSVSSTLGTRAYLSGATHNSLRFQQVADTLYVANTGKVVEGTLGRGYAPWRQPGDAGVFIQRTNYNHEYSLTYNATTVTVTTQVDSANYVSRGYSGTQGAGFAQPYRINAAQANGTEPVLIRGMQASVVANDIGEVVVGAIDRARVLIGQVTIPNDNVHCLAMQAEPSEGQPTAATWNSDHSHANLTTVTPAHFDVDFQAVYLDPTDPNVVAGEWYFFGNNGAKANQTQLTPQYVARQLAAAVKADLQHVEGDEMWGPSPDYVPSSAFHFSTNNIPLPTVDLVVEDLATPGTPVEDMGYAWTDEMDAITHLPIYFKQGAVVRITGSPTTSDDDYYVQFATTEWRDDTDSNEDAFFSYSADLFGIGAWRETTEPGQTTGGLDSTTMPHRLRRNPDGSWVFEAVGWGQRPAGDNLTNPEPSFVGGRIFDVFYHEDRLGFASGSGLIMSESGEIENFWRTTVLSVPASDPIDVALSALQGNTIYHAVPFDKSLYVFSEDAQAEIDGSGGALTPASVSAKITGRYRSSALIPPAAQGASLFSPYKTGENMQVREILPGDYDGDLQAGDITMSTPRLLPTTLRKLLTSSGGNDLLALTEDGEIYLYQYLRAGRESLMSAWGRWDLPGGSLLDAVTIHDSVYLLVDRVAHDGTRTFLEKINIGAGRGDVTTAFKVRSDRQVPVASGSYDITTDTTTYAVPFAFHDDDTLLVTVDQGGSLEYGGPIGVSTQDASAGTVGVSGDLSGQPVLIGIPYDCEITMSQPMAMRQTQSGMTAALGGNTLVRDLTLSLADTGYLTAAVTCVGYGTSTDEFLADRMDVGEVSPSPLATREWQIPIHASNDEFIITLSNPTALPSTLVSGGWALRHNSKY